MRVVAFASNASLRYDWTIVRREYNRSWCGEYRWSVIRVWISAIAVDVRLFLVLL